MMTTALTKQGICFRLGEFLSGQRRTTHLCSHSAEVPAADSAATGSEEEKSFSLKEVAPPALPMGLAQTLG